MKYKEKEKKSLILSWLSLSIYSARRMLPSICHILKIKNIDHVIQVCKMCSLIRLYTTQGIIFLSQKILCHYHISRQICKVFIYVLHVFKRLCIFFATVNSLLHFLNSAGIKVLLIFVYYYSIFNEFFNFL